MIRNFCLSSVAKAVHCPRPRFITSSRIFFSLLLTLLFYENSFSQVEKTTQAGVIEAGFGVNPNLTGASSVAVKGNYAYVVGTGDVLEILDITLSGLPAHKGSLANGVGGAVIQRPQHIVVQGNYAYITSQGANALEIVDISNPALPVHKSIIYDGGGSAPYLNVAWGLAVSGNYAFVTFATGLEIIDISNPASPAHKGSIHDGGGKAPYLNQAFSVFVSGNLAYVGSQGALEIIDISNPALPVHKGALLNGGGAAPFLSAVYSVYVSGNYAYATDSDNGAIEIVDISNPTLPVHAASMVDNATTGPYLQGSFALTIVGNYLYVVGNNRDFEIIDITNPLHPVHKAGFTNNPLMSKAREIVIVGKYAYVPSRNSNGLNIIDISNASSPTIKGTATSGAGGALLNTANSVYVADGYAYVGNASINPVKSGFEIVDVSNPAVPLHAGSILTSPTSAYPTGGISAVTKSGNTVFMANNYYNALILVDVTNPQAPIQQSSVVDGQQSSKLIAPTSVQVSPNGNFAYVTSGGSNAVNVINVSDRSNPQNVGVLVDGNGSAPYLKKPTSMAISTFGSGSITYGFVTSFTSNALETIDLSNPTNPIHLGSLRDGNGNAPYLKQPKSVFVQGNYAYVASAGSSALEIVDITNPSLPFHKGAFKSTILDSLNFVYVSGNYAYITCAALGAGSPVKGTLEVVDISNPANPVHYETFTSGTTGALIDYPTSVFVSGNYGYITNTGLYQSMDIVYLYGPGITSFSPASAAVGSIVTVTGQNFNTFVAASVNGVEAPVTAVSENTLSFTVPPTASNGKITLHYTGQSFSSATNFIVIPTAADASPIQQNTFTAKWSDVGATNYFFDLSTDNFTTFTGGYNNYALDNVTSLAIAGLTPATAYQYRVRSSNGTLVSSNSNVMSVLTIPATPVAHDPVSINQTTFSASWVTVAGATSYYLDVATDESFTQFVVGYDNLSIPASSETSQMVTGLTSFNHYYYRVRAANATGSSPSSGIITVVTQDITAPVISNPQTPNPTTVTVGASPVLNSVITDNVTVYEAQLFCRGISKPSFNKVSLQGPGGLGGNYSITIQPDWYDSLGMEYYFVAKDEAGNETVSDRSYIQLITPSITLPTLPSGPGLSDYRIVAFPYQLTENKVTTVYSNIPWNDNTKAGLWWWDPNLKNGKGDYDKYSVSATLQTIEPGKGYWVITRSPVSPTLSNVPAPKYNQSSLFSMTLKPGWNEIGNPYPVSISWDDVIAYNLANNPGALFGPLTIYDGSGYKAASGNTLLHAFEGGFVKNLGSSDISIHIPFKGKSNSDQRVSTISSDISDQNWNIFLHINQNGRTNELGGFGMNSLALSGIDRFDNFNPPRFLDIPDVSFTNVENPGVSFSNDMVPSQDDYVWTFTAGGKEGSDAQLRWNARLNTSSSKQLFLLDEEQLNIIDMGSVNQYSFALSNANRFRIFYGSHVKVTTSQIVASAPFPNPLVGGDKVTINLALPESSSDYSINMQIYNAQGSMIGSLNKILTSGIHPIEFALPNSLGEGIYIYKLAVANEKTSSIYTGKIVKP